jgi:hypothetical protein
MRNISRKFITIPLILPGMRGSGVLVSLLPLSPFVSNCTSSAVDTAKGLWSLLLPHGLKGGALSRSSPTDANGDVKMGGVEPTGGQNWTDERTATWFQFLDEKRVKGISKDIWQMVRRPSHLFLTFQFLSLSLH